jgi:hypothetical protein
MCGFAASSIRPCCKFRRTALPNPGTCQDCVLRIARVRTASSAVPLARLQGLFLQTPGYNRRERTSLVSLRNNRFPISCERIAASLPVSGFLLSNLALVSLRPAGVPVIRDTDFSSRTACGTRTAAMRPRSLTEAAKDKEFSCRKNWLSMQVPMSAGLRSWKKVS